MNMKRNLLAAAVLSTLGLASGAAQAVYLGEDGTGEVLIYPYYTVRDGYFTTMSVVNTTAEAKAVKVRYIEGKNSREVLDFNLYLSPYDVWTGAIEATANGAMISTSDTSCTAPALSASQGGPGSVEFRNFEYSGAEADGEDTSLNRTREGYVEIIEMGVLNNNSIPASTSTGTIAVDAAVTHNSSGKPADCGAIVKAWASGGAFISGANGYLSAPTGGLFGSASMIRTDIGTDYSVDAVALDAWSDSANHTAPGSLSPSLADASPFESIVFYEGSAISSNWFNSQDAVSAVLMRNAVMNEYTVESIVNGNTDWVVTFPTKRFYAFVDPTSAGDPDNAHKYFYAPFSEDFYTGGSCEKVDLTYYNREELKPVGSVDFSPLPPSGSTSLCWEVNVVTFNGGGVLGSQLNSNLNVGTYQNGWLYMGLTNGTNDTDQDGANTRELGSLDGDTYAGLPVIGFAVQEFVRGDGSLDNYGGNFVHRYTRDIDD